MTPQEAVKFGFEDEMNKLGFNPAFMKGLTSFLKGWKGIGKGFLRGSKTQAGGLGRATRAFKKQWKYNPAFRTGTIATGAGLGAYTMAGGGRRRY